MANAFEYALYYAQGRTTGGVNEDYCLTLGFPDEKSLDETTIGDNIAFDQDIVTTDVDYVQMWVQGECHSDFAMDIMLDGALVESYVIGEPYITTNVFMPVAINVSGITGTHNLKFRLRRIV